MGLIKERGIIQVKKRDRKMGWVGRSRGGGGRGDLTPCMCLLYCILSFIISLVFLHLVPGITSLKSSSSSVVKSLQEERLNAVFLMRSIKEK